MIIWEEGARGVASHVLNVSLDSFLGYNRVSPVCSFGVFLVAAMPCHFVLGFIFLQCVF